MERNGENYMNLIPMIRETLGLEIEEEFQLVKSDGTTYDLKYRFASNDMLQWFDTYTGCWNVSSPTMLEKIIYGLATIKKLPFKPKEGKLYYFIDLDNGDAMGVCYYSNMSHHKLRVKSGNCYRTEEEAEKHVDEWMTKVYGKDWRELLK